MHSLQGGNWEQFYLLLFTYSWGGVNLLFIWGEGTGVKSRDISLPTKVRIVKAMVFPVVTQGCESWTVKEAECQRIDAFEPWSWRRLLKVPWTARRSNQSILTEMNPAYSLEGLVEVPVFWSSDVNWWLIGKVPDAGKDQGQKKRASEDEMAGL